ncbi:MAG: hypothetical protein BWK77_06075 [Verrucomicrobia bacterium A1]|nr:MAG: hypothetical protein BWK77_06075 [Verrucomicrobia bacterium A1]
MNVNEVVANRALERMGRPLGDYATLHPIETVNLHQSTNDTVPTAARVAAILELRELSAALAALQGACQRREDEFARIVKIGRTELQEAVPLTLGAEFSAFAEAFGRDRWRTFKCEERLRVVNLGGTAVGTGLTAPQSYIFLVVERLREITGLGLARAENLVDGTANADAFAEVSGVLDACAAHANGSVALITAMVPLTGYERAQALAQEYAASGRVDLRAFLAERLGAEAVETCLSPAALMALGHQQHPIEDSQ